MAKFRAQISHSRVGYLKASEYFYRLFTGFLSLAALAIASPLILAISLLILLQDGWPIFYVGIRLGKDKKPFRMYKFRTLIPEAYQLIGAEQLRDQCSSSRTLFTRSGKFLRETRLDEIPQFLNTLKGDMDLLGPRPVRPEVYEKICSHIPGYDIRFTVRPGLIGYSQLFTPHSTSERIRALIDYKFLLRKHRYSSEIGLFISSLILLGVRLLQRTGRSFLHLLKLLIVRRKEKRVVDRRFPKGVTVKIRPESSAAETFLESSLEDANEEAIAVWTASELPPGRLQLEMKIPVRRHFNGGQREIVKTIDCVGEIYYVKADGGNNHFRYVLKYTPLSAFNYYLLHQHLLQSSILAPS